MLETQEIRQKYLDFFKARGHEILPSSSLLPENDPTTLFTGSGMQPMITYLLGAKHPLGARLADSQKCFRTQDIEEVGDNRHTTFFEMLGNWSLGDYFKKQQIAWMYEFLTRELKLNPKRLYFTCFRGKEDDGVPRDEESAKLLQELLLKDGVDAKIVDFPENGGMRDGRIFYYDEKKNWWSRAGEPLNMPVGEPGGPDAEIFWDFGQEHEFHKKSPYKNQLCHVNCDCGRFLEIGNNVFMEYQRTDSGFSQLPQKNVDFGGGLERMAAALQDTPDIFSIDLFAGIRDVITKLSKRKYEPNNAEAKAFRVIMDHIRAATFLIADGAVPCNKDQGYFVRRLIRRLVRYANQLGLKEHICPALGEAVIETYKISYPMLEEKSLAVLTELKREEDKFRKKLDMGIRQFNEIIAGMRQGAVIDAMSAFDLYQTFGFPLEMTIELAEEHGLTVDELGFKTALGEHQELSRQGSLHKFKGGLSDNSEISVKYHTATHLLHSALKRVLGDRVEQKGSNITPERLRFDFSYPEKMTSEQIKQTEDLVNDAIARDYKVSFSEMPVDEAMKKKAIGLFHNRYNAIVKVYTIGDPDIDSFADTSISTFSREICGGPHVANTGIIGHFKIIKEEACSAGVRRIKAVVE